MGKKPGSAVALGETKGQKDALLQQVERQWILQWQSRSTLSQWGSLSTKHANPDPLITAPTFK